MKYTLEEIQKRKLSLQELYLLSLRQILLNHSCILNNVDFAKTSEALANRITEFLENKE